MRMMTPHEERMEQVKTIDELEGIKWIGWMTKEDADGDWNFQPESEYIRIEDGNNHFYQVYLSGNGMNPESYFHRSLWIGIFLNQVMSSLGILPEGKWIGLNWSVSNAVNYCRHHMEKREHEVVKGGYFQHFHIF